MGFIYIKDGCSYKEIKAAVDAMYLLGFQTEKVRFPVVKPGERVETDSIWHIYIMKKYPKIISRA